MSFPLFVVMNGNNPVRDCVLSGSFRLEYIFRDIWGCVWIRLGDPESIVLGGWAREDPFLQSLVDRVDRTEESFITHEKVM